jgi:hypothetical protein
MIKHIESGTKFGKLMVICDAGSGKRRKTYLWVVCECGSKIRRVRKDHLTSGKAIGCGCTRGVRTHNMSKSVEYKTYKRIITRCYNTKNKRYHDYGGRGITVCDRWLESFENFYEDMGDRPSKDHSIDRINNNKGYSKDNCRWVTNKIQSRNKRNTVYITIDGKTLSISDWVDIVGTAKCTIYTRLRRGWSEYEAVYGRRKNG